MDTLRRGLTRWDAWWNGMADVERIVITMAIVLVVYQAWTWLTPLSRLP